MMNTSNDRVLSFLCFLVALRYSHVSAWMAGADDPKELGGHSEASPCPGEELQVACLCSTGHRSFMSFMECLVETLADEF